MGFFEHHGLKMHYEIIPNLLPFDTLFIHGNLASNNWWQPSIEIWKNEPGEKKGSLIMAEWRGCGKSSGPGEEHELNLSILAQDYVDLLESLNIKKVNLVTHSTGGLIGLYAVRKNPALFHRIELLDSVAATGVQFGPEMYDAFTAMSQDLAMCKAIIAGTIYSKNISENLLNELVNDAFNVHPLIWHGVPKMIHTVNFKPELAHINNPTLVLHGEMDTLLPKAGSEEYAALLPNAKFMEVKGQGHSTNVENPKLFVEITNQFLFG